MNLSAGNEALFRIFFHVLSHFLHNKNKTKRYMLTIAWVERENYEYYVKNLTDLCSGEFKKVFKNPMCVSSLFHLLKCCTLILMKQK